VTEQPIRTLFSAEHGGWNSAAENGHGQSDEDEDEHDEHHDDQGVAHHEGEPDASSEHAAGADETHNP
jgi:hypothetical protein